MLEIDSINSNAISIAEKLAWIRIISLAYRVPWTESERTQSRNLSPDPNKHRRDSVLSRCSKSNGRSSFSLKTRSRRAGRRFELSVRFVRVRHLDFRDEMSHHHYQVAS